MDKVAHLVLFLLQPVTVPILRTTVMLILANAFVPLTLRDKNVNSAKKITGDSLLNLVARYGRLDEKPWLLKAINLIQMSELESCFENRDLYSLCQSVNATCSH